jgi:hypothetical protein
MMEMPATPLKRGVAIFKKIGLWNRNRGQN